MSHSTVDVNYWASNIFIYVPWLKAILMRLSIFAPNSLCWAKLLYWSGHKLHIFWLLKHLRGSPKSVWTSYFLDSQSLPISSHQGFYGLKGFSMLSSIRSCVLVCGMACSNFVDFKSLKRMFERCTNDGLPNFSIGVCQHCRLKEAVTTKCRLDS